MRVIPIYIITRINNASTFWTYHPAALTAHTISTVVQNVQIVAFVREKGLSYMRMHETIISAQNPKHGLGRWLLVRPALYKSILRLGCAFDDFLRV